MKSFALGVLVTVVVIVLVVHALFASGSVPVETSAQPLPFEKRLTTMALETRAKKNMPHQIPMQASQDNLAAGGKVYSQHCALCHGMPGEQRPAVSKGMFPPPPELYKDEQGVTGDPAAETYWKVRNGIRLSGMPAFNGILPEAELWQVSLFLANRNNTAILQQLEAQQGTPPSRTAAAKPAVVVRITDDQLLFNPATISIKAGQTVEWINASREVHTVTADPKSASNSADVALPKGVQPFDSGYFDPGQTYSHTFPTPGTYRYVCTLHEVQHMIGEVIVKP